MIEEQNDALQRKNKIALERYRFAIECLGTYPKKVVDLGCGMGYGAHMLREAGHTVVGIDKSKEAIAYAKKNYPGRYMVGDLENAMVDGFDAGVCLEMLCHMEEPEKFIYRIGMKELVVSAPIDPNPDDGYFYRLHNLSETEFKNMFIGYKIVRELRQKKYLALHLIKITSYEQDPIY